MVAPGWAKRSPPSASTWPAAIFRRVDLPEPLRPTSARRSPAPTLSSAPSSNWVLPKRIEMSLRKSSGAIGAMSDGAPVQASSILGSPSPRGLALLAQPLDRQAHAVAHFEELRRLHAQTDAWRRAGGDDVAGD